MIDLTKMEIEVQGVRVLVQWGERRFAFHLDDLRAARKTIRRSLAPTLRKPPQGYVDQAAVKLMIRMGMAQ
jgi:hypothetical protein